MIFAPRSLTSSSLTPLQSQVDGWVGGFTRQATDWRSLAAMTAGRMPYRAGRIGVMGFGSGNGIRLASVGLGLSAEVSAFELTHRGLTTLSRRGGPMWPPALESTIGGHPPSRGPGGRRGGAPE